MESIKQLDLFMSSRLLSRDSNYPAIEIESE